MEVLHSIFGFVRSPVITALMQWAGRTHVLMSVVHAIPALHSTNAAALMFIAWSLTEVIDIPPMRLAQTFPGGLTTSAIPCSFPCTRSVDHLRFGSC